MLFSTSTFLFYFLPVFLLVYYLSPNALKNLVILLASIFFYTWGENLLVLVMLFSLTVDYFAGLLIDKNKRKLGLALSLITNLSLLGFFKYYNFFSESLADFAGLFGLVFEPKVMEMTLPLGISFYTFQSLSYTIDVYRGQVKANKNFLQFATYVTMFPQLIAGPIVRYVDVYNQLTNKNISVENFYEGTKRFILGLAKKMIIANACGYIADQIFAINGADLSTPVAWLGIIAYTFQLYYDFSGYSDMAIGLAKMLGFDLLENFNYPFISKSMTELWTRWHISLSTWTHNYIFLPLNMAKWTKNKILPNLFITFLVLGFWHGANWTFVIFRVIHGLAVVIEHATKRNRNLLKKRIGGGTVGVLGWLMTMLIFLISMVFFRSDNVTLAIQYLKKLFSFSSGSASMTDYIKFYCFNIESIIVLLLAVIFSFPIYKWMDQRTKTGGLGIKIGETVCLMMLLIISTSYIVNDSYNPFIYFRF